MSLLNVFTIIIVTMLFVGFFIPIVKRVAFHVGALDIPNARKVHTKPIPRLGGLGIYAGFLLGYIMFGFESIQMNAILIGSIIIVITGMVDDIKPISAKHKFLGQLVAALIIPVYGGIILKDISFFGIYIDFGVFSYPLTVFFILGVINCMNLIDGLDGLAGGIASIYFFTIGVISIFFMNSSGLDTILTFIMLGSTLGFLFHNFNPASIFMGDSGSMFLGYMIAVIALLGYKNITFTSFIVPIFLLAIPIMDTLFAILRRLVNHKPISEPDKNHLHHQFLKQNFSQKRTVLIIYFIDILFATASIVYLLGNRYFGMVVYGILFILVLLLILKTDIIFERNKK